MEDKKKIPGLTIALLVIAIVLGIVVWNSYKDEECSDLDSPAYERCIQGKQAYGDD